MIREGKVEDGIARFVQATASMNDPGLYLNYASLLFYRAQQLLRAGRQPESEALFKEVERELLEVMRLSEHTPGEGSAIMSSQCAYLLGEIYGYVFKDPQRAQAQYQAALRSYPDHPGALEAMTRIMQATIGEAIKRTTAPTESPTASKTR